MRPRTWDAPLNQVLKELPSRLAAEQLLAIGRSAIDRANAEQAYLASAAGLATAAGPTAARFLLLRAKSFPYWADRRASQCLRAAMDLAQRRHDKDLMDQVAAESDKQTSSHFGFGHYSHEPLGEGLVAEVIKAERQAPAYPRTNAEAERHVVAILSRRAPGADVDEDDDDFGFWGAAADDDEDWDEEDEYDEDYDDEPGLAPGALFSAGRLPGKLPPAAAEIAEEVVERFGRLPSPAELMNSAPDLLLRLLAAMGGLSLDDKSLAGLLNDLGNSAPPSPGGGGRKRKRKNRGR